MNERNYKNLLLDRTNLRQSITNYLQDNGFNLHKDEEDNSKWRLEFSRPNENTCLINIFFNNNGTSTIQYKQGQNQIVGKDFADYLYDTINPNELRNVDMTLCNIMHNDFDVILETLKSEFDDIVINITPRGHDLLIQIKSDYYKDYITLIHYNNRKLQIQGKPLTCYKRLIYYISDLLDLSGIESVLMKSDSSRAEVLNLGMAEFHLKNQLGEDIFEQFNHSIKSLLLSSFCVKFSSPKLPDYCMLLYPEFRALEGMLKQKLLEYGLIASQCEGIDSFGGFFVKKTPKESFSIKQEYQQKIPCKDMQKRLCDAFEFFNKHRNRLFHMNEHVDSSRMISDINEMNRISNIIYSHLKNLI
ncbi:type II toxin-antitoxin system RnlA family toxin [Gilliamella sp. App4-10]|uniref:type II toxin-antitoxin system RnlA family toxin n=1 Tax=Gilliamella sp. App4-10 TaxID=3120231 RepID=UPI00080DCA3C|nr:type II toxin-antitoxin system RnlA family toxin [Gilliamella apicola]